MVRSGSTPVSMSLRRTSRRYCVPSSSLHLYSAPEPRYALYALQSIRAYLGRRPSPSTPHGRNSTRSAAASSSRQARGLRHPVSQPAGGSGTDQGYPGARDHGGRKDRLFTVRGMARAPRPPAARRSETACTADAPRRESRGLPTPTPPRPPNRCSRRSPERCPPILSAEPARHQITARYRTLSPHPGNAGVTSILTTRAAAPPCLRVRRNTTAVAGHLAPSDAARSDDQVGREAAFQPRTAPGRFRPASAAAVGAGEQVFIAVMQICA
ncbi:hypothetical protein D9M68_136320 [compost metagenome]